MDEGSVEARVAARFKPEHVAVRHGRFEVEETDDAGKMRVEVIGPEGAVFVVAKASRTGWPALKEEKQADGAALLVRGDEADAVIVECKRAMNPAHWSKALAQMTWSLHRLRAIAGVLGVRVVRVGLYPAFEKDHLSSPADLALLKGGLGDGSEDPDMRAWRTGRVRLKRFALDFEHTPVQAGGEPPAATLRVS